MEDDESKTEAFLILHESKMGFRFPTECRECGWIGYRIDKQVFERYEEK